jgi:hypothetical protein
MVSYSGDGEASIQLLDGRPSDIGSSDTAFALRSSPQAVTPDPSMTMQVEVKHENEASWIFPQ